MAMEFLACGTGRCLLTCVYDCILACNVSFC